jgi:diaminopimelate decarboxylase
MAQGRSLAPVERGELLAIFTAGAYGYTMSSNYNSRPQLPEVLVDGDKYTIIRKRQTYEDLIALER